MANRVQILDKIQRNCAQLGISVSRPSAESLVAAGLTITYSDAVIQSPMGGVDGSVSPFLGIGIANPGKLVLSAAPSSLDQFRVLRVMSGHANAIVISGLGELESSSDAIGLGM